jgi:carbonic anhydrase
VSGLLGGIPVTQVIVRSSANVTAGGRTKVATVVHGLLLLACVYFIPSWLNLIPLSCLAAILLVIGYKLAKVELFVGMYRQGWTQFMPFVVTVLGILFTNLLQGIAIGMGVAIFYILKSNYHTPFYFQQQEHHEGDKIHIRLSEEVSFLNKASIMIMLEGLPKHAQVTIDGTGSNYIDYDVIEIIENFIAHAPLRHIRVEVVGIPGVSAEHLERRSRTERMEEGLPLKPSGGGFGAADSREDFERGDG